MTLILSAKQWKVHVDSKHLSTITQKVYRFLDSLIRNGNGKFYLLLREYSQRPVNVLSSSPEISDLIKNNLF